MIKVNLETELLKENRKIHSPKELLEIKEYDRLGDNLISDLETVFPNMPAKSGRNAKSNSLKKIKETEKFNQERVFHITQIKSICDKYLLRFLKTKYYCGHIDSGLTKAVSEFEIDNGITLSAEINSFIIAPASSFVLEAKPKDPLLFYKINEEYYYLIHKWGNDLSSLRAFKSVLNNIFCNNRVWLFIFFILIPSIVTTVFVIPHCKDASGAVLFSIVTEVFMVVVAMLSQLIVSLFSGDIGSPMEFDWVKKHKYNSSEI